MRGDLIPIPLVLGGLVLVGMLVWRTRLEARAQAGDARVCKGSHVPLSAGPAADAGPSSDGWRELNTEEERVIVHKGTERPFTGKYHEHFSAGIYACRRCGAMLYRSEDKFRSHCGWPAFDDEMPGAVKRLQDADGVRTEIVCANCGGHLGHVFLGEGLTPKDTRHCVNSVSLDFIPADEVIYGRAIFAAGCFWGVEYWFQQQPGVLDTVVGYTGGHTQNPTYESVHQHDTGHAEAVEVLYDPVRVSYEQLVKLFFDTHDPTQRDGQGPDIGAQYRSAIFYENEDQKRIADDLIAQLQARGVSIATQVVSASRFWPAEDYHQDWYLRKGSRPVCHRRKPLW
jgi:peptide methionine sulfoxide reductase msrA/msrB